MNLVTGLWGMNVHVPGQDVPGVSRSIHPSCSALTSVRVVWRHSRLSGRVCGAGSICYGESQFDVESGLKLTEQWKCFVR